MEFKKVLPALAITLGLAASVAQAATPQNTPSEGYQPNQPQQSGLFQLDEVNGNGTPVAEGDDDEKCGAGSCGSDDGDDEEGSDDGDDGGDHKCAAGSCGGAH